MPYAIQQLFFDLDQTTVEAIRDKAVAMILEGKSLMSWSVAGNNFTKTFAMPPAEALAEAKAALRNLNGDRVTKTYSNFRWSGWK